MFTYHMERETFVVGTLSSPIYVIQSGYRGLVETIKNLSHHLKKQQFYSYKKFHYFYDNLLMWKVLISIKSLLLLMWKVTISITSLSH